MWERGIRLQLERRRKEGGPAYRFRRPLPEHQRRRTRFELPPDDLCCFYFSVVALARLLESVNRVLADRVERNEQEERRQHESSVDCEPHAAGAPARDDRD